MQTSRIVQAVILMLIVAVAASCAASKEYTSKLFTPRDAVEKDTQATALRFLELDQLEPDQENWVTTDIIMGRDTVSATVHLDKLAATLPAAPVTGSKELVKDKDVVKDSAAVTVKPVKPIPVVATEPVAKSANPGEVRNKKTRE